MKNYFIFPLLALLLALGWTGCTKEGFGGEASISGTVKHHSAPIPNAVVYIKFDAKESPGTDGNAYDASVAADSNGNYSFTGLYRGDYFLFGSGWDPGISQAVYGGIPVKITNKTAQLSINVPVTED